LTASLEPIDPLLEEAARVADVLAANWRRGQCCRAEELLADHPTLRDHPRAAVRVIYEEICQRQELGQEVAHAELEARFPQWRDELAVVLDCHHVLGLSLHVPRFPVVGETLGEFRLLAELGQGGRGRVYLAEQANLAGRLMVLKVTPCSGQEHLKLARLQHTHIVPLYMVRDFPDRNLRQLGMPCLGGATLQQLLRQLRSIAPEKRTGRDLLAALPASTTDARMSWSAQGPNRRFLEQASYVEAICWMGVCLAEALHYAHEQGLVHLDVKPSNILLTADCQPMLLDFHLARGPIQPHGDDPEWLGGTPAYMSPEQRSAWRACFSQQPIPAAVGARSDLYSLGLLLREALYGEPRAEGVREERPPPRPHLSPGLRDILARCLRNDPARRYPTAAALAEDLRRHLTHRPLLSVGNRSLAERWRKWRRRRPQALLLSLLLAACLGTAAAFGILYAQQAAQHRREATDALSQGRRFVLERRYAEALESFDRGLQRLAAEAADDRLQGELQRERRRAARAHDLQTLHEAIERSRYLHGDEFVAREVLQKLDERCRSAWEDREQLLDAGGDPLADDIEEGLRRDLLDAAVLWADCRVRLAAASEGTTARRDALRILNDADALFGPSPVLSRERRALLEALGSAPKTPEVEPAPRTAWEHYLLGRWFLRAGDTSAAAAAFDRAVGMRPQDFWPWFGKGLCAHRRGRADEAAKAFTVCVALAPNNAACYHNRARALAECGDVAGALRDYDHALQLDPRLAAAALNRGALQLQQRHFAEAEADFGVALRLGAHAAAVHYNRALLHQARQEYSAALECLDLALQNDPAHQPSRDLRERLQRLHSTDEGRPR
jgi:serine/threonine protein kinase/tetratricopeptide (TPR) repeat protein